MSIIEEWACKSSILVDEDEFSNLSGSVNVHGPMEKSPEWYRTLFFAVYLHKGSNPYLF